MFAVIFRPSHQIVAAELSNVCVGNWYEIVNLLVSALSCSPPRRHMPCQVALFSNSFPNFTVHPPRPVAANCRNKMPIERREMITYPPPQEKSFRSTCVLSLHFQVIRGLVCHFSIFNCGLQVHTWSKDTHEWKMDGWDSFKQRKIFQRLVSQM